MPKKSLQRSRHGKNALVVRSAGKPIGYLELVETAVGKGLEIEGQKPFTVRLIGKNQTYTDNQHPLLSVDKVRVGERFQINGGYFKDLTVARVVKILLDNKTFEIDVKELQALLSRGSAGKLAGPRMTTRTAFDLTKPAVMSFEEFLKSSRPH